MVLHSLVNARSHARSLAGEPFFLGDVDKPTKINGIILGFSTVIPCAVASAGEAEYAALFARAQHAAVLRTMLSDIGYPQPDTIVLCDNTTAIGITTDSVKQKCSKAIDMLFHWVRNRVRQKQFRIAYIPLLKTSPTTSQNTCHMKPMKLCRVYRVHTIGYTVRYNLGAEAPHHSLFNRSLSNRK